MTWYKFILSLLGMFTAVAANAQGEIEMADKLRSEGGIYVVVLTLTIILAGIFVYLIVTGRKVKKLEDELKNQRGE